MCVGSSRNNYQDVSPDSGNATGAAAAAGETLVSTFLRAFRSRQRGAIPAINQGGGGRTTNHTNGYTRTTRNRYVTTQNNMLDSSTSSQKHLNGLYRRHVRILLLGDQHVGKTSLILSLISEEFLLEVPARAEEITIPPDVTPQHVPTHIVDFSFEEQDETDLFEEVSRADVVCLVFSLDEVSSIESARTYWLPLLSENSLQSAAAGGDQGNQEGVNTAHSQSPLPAPIILVGNKSDLVNPEFLIQSHIEPIMNDFPNIETFVACSAKDLSNVSEVFHYAQKAVLHPSSPLFNYEINELTISAVRALHRIFRLCDLDNDGYLNDNEINYLQVKAFGAPLDKINLTEIKQLIDYNCVDGLHHDCITESGFVYLNNLFIQRGRIETTWTILRSFGYADDLSLRSDLIQPQFTLKSGCSVELSSVGIEFLTSLFHKHDRDHDGALSPQELVDLFDVCLHSNPWGMDVLHSVTTNSKGWIDLPGFLCQWNMTAFLDTPRFLEYLAYFGYMQFDQSNVSTAIRVTRPKSEDLKSRICTRNVFLCHVIGPEGAGKSSFLQGLLGRTVRDVRNLDHVNELSRYAINTLSYKATHNKFLLMHDFDVVKDDLLTDEDLDCDVIALMYDASDKNSFENVAVLYRNHFLHSNRSSRAGTLGRPTSMLGGRPGSMSMSYSASVTPPVLICGAKSDRLEVKQEFEMSPQQFCRHYNLPPPILVSSWSEIKPDVYNTLLSLAINPHKRGYGYGYLYSMLSAFSSVDLMTKAAAVSGMLAISGFFIYRLIS